MPTIHPRKKGKTNRRAPYSKPSFSQRFFLKEIDLLSHDQIEDAISGLIKHLRRAVRSSHNELDEKEVRKQSKLVEEEIKAITQEFMLPSPELTEEFLYAEMSSLEKEIEAVVHDNPDYIYLSSDESFVHQDSDVHKENIRRKIAQLQKQLRVKQREQLRATVVAAKPSLAPILPKSLSQSYFPYLPDYMRKSELKKRRGRAIQTGHLKAPQGPKCNQCDSARSSAMVGCEVCGSWSHLECRSLSTVEAMCLVSYICADCLEADPTFSLHSRYKTRDMMVAEISRMNRFQVQKEVEMIQNVLLDFDGLVSSQVDIGPLAGSTGDSSLSSGQVNLPNEALTLSSGLSVPNLESISSAASECSAPALDDVDDDISSSEEDEGDEGDEGDEETLQNEIAHLQEGLTVVEQEDANVRECYSTSDEAFVAGESIVSVNLP